MATRTAAINQIYDDIRDKILKNEYIPGSKLSENFLSVDYNCSNTGKFSPTSRHATLPRGRSSCSPTCGESAMRIRGAESRPHILGHYENCPDFKNTPSTCNRKECSFLRVP